MMVVYSVVWPILEWLSDKVRALRISLNKVAFLKNQRQWWSVVNNKRPILKLKIFLESDQTMYQLRIINDEE
ncbi:hypothetical protein FGO68_gene15995 [Halteria grandinella]|uniref:Uncharacterized protein n=1 Tax=Halteria grandinella TaxID=5974 RepID=A0A8J8P6X0_HALGN|nr:hypothetical protein FGO68_gene15995 [Halteria grandinella]